MVGAVANASIAVADIVAKKECVSSNMILTCCCLDGRRLLGSLLPGVSQNKHKPAFRPSSPLKTFRNIFKNFESSDDPEEQRANQHYATLGSVSYLIQIRLFRLYVVPQRRRAGLGKAFLLQ